MAESDDEANGRLREVAESEKRWSILIHSIETCLNEKKYQQAEPLALYALELMEEHKDDDPRLIKTLRVLSRIYYATERYWLGAPILKRLVKIYTNLLGPAHEDTATIMQNAALLYHYWGKKEEAEAYYQKSLAIKRTLLGEDDPQVTKLMTHYINFLEHCGREKEAQKLAQSVADAARKKLSRTGRWESMTSEQADQLTSS